MGRLDNKVAIVTGAGRGLGRGIAMKLAEEGAKVVVADMAGAENVVKEIEEKGGTAAPFAVNVTNQKEVQDMVAFAVDTYGTLDIMVNNAGINRDGMLHKMPVENWNTVIDVDLTGTFYGTQEAIKYMRPRESGRIINISSGSWLGNIGQANYAASKAGVIGFTKTVAQEGALRGVRCNAIAPGMIASSMTAAIDEKRQKEIKERIPLKRLGTAEEVAQTALFLAQNDYLTGEVINVDGGMAM